MPIHQNFHSHHLGELKEEIKKKFSYELNSAKNTLMKQQVKEVIGCLEKAIVPVDILRSFDFNMVLDKKKNFYGLRLHFINEDAHIIAKYPNIRRTLQIGVEMMTPKDLWKTFLTTVLVELQEDENNFSSLMKIGSDFKFSNFLNEEIPDFFITGPNNETDFPLLLVDMSSKHFNTTKMQNMMTAVLIDTYNSRNYWPLPELNHLVVYGLIIVDYEYYICKMALRPEKDLKFAFVFTKGKRLQPRSLFIDPKSKKKSNSSYHEEVAAEIRRGDQDSTDDEEYENSEDEWVTCYFCQTCHYQGKGCLLNGFEELSIGEDENKSKRPETRKYTRPHGGGVVAIISLLQTVLAQHLIVKAKDASYKKLKPKKL